MPCKVIFTPLARNDSIEIYEYYANLDYNAAEHFAKELIVCETNLADHPEIGSVYKSDIRQLVMHKFHYSLFYEVQTKLVIIHAVASQLRHPGYWHNRIT